MSCDVFLRILSVLAALRDGLQDLGFESIVTRLDAVGTMKGIENFRFDTGPFFVLFGQAFRILPQEAISLQG